MAEIKNVVFDIGNVIVNWSPAEIVRLTFGAAKATDELTSSIFKSDLWMALNRGEMPESEAKLMYQERLGFTTEHTDQLFYYVKHTQLILFGSLNLLQRVKSAGYRTFALTDNVNEIVDHLKSQYDFWPLFDGTIVSSELGCMKPHPEIFNHLLDQHNLSATECVFIDDMPHNLKGATSLGFSGIQFENADQCERELKSLGLSF